MTTSRFARLSLALAATAAVAACGPAPAWTQLLGDAGHTASNPAETALTSRTVGTLHPTWSVPSNTSSVVVDGTTLFDAEGIGGRNLVVGRDLVTGRARWTVPVAAADRRYLSADGASGTLYAYSFAGGSSTLTAYAQATGRQTWSKSLASGRGGLTFGDGRIFVNGENGTRAFDTSGRALWGSAFGADGGSYAAGRYYAGPQVLDAATGRVLFRYDIQTNPPAPTQVSGARALVAGGNNVTNNNQGAVAVYPAAGCGQPTCRPSRVIQTAGQQYDPVATTGDTVLARNFAGVVAYSLATGAPLWRETSDNDVLDSLIAGDLVWTYDGGNHISAYRLGGCGAPVCAPVKRYSAPWVVSSQGFLVTQGKLVLWGLQGIHVLSP
jgi:hypothetical protein